RRHRGRRSLPPPAERRRRPVPFLHAQSRRPHLRNLPPARSPPPMTRVEKADLLREIAQERILIKDGPYGTAIQNYRLDEAGYRAGRDFSHDQKGNNDLLNLTRPEIVSEICNAYIDAGADLLATNTFNANAISQADYGIQDRA